MKIFLLSAFFLLAVKSSTAQNDPIPSGWKTYSNTKYGFSFRYPPGFSQVGKEYEGLNLSGKLTMAEINFSSSLSGSRLVIQYHPAPAGAQLYHYADSALRSSVARHSKDMRELQLSSGKAIETVSTMSVNGKGNRITSLRSVIVDFLDPQKTGEMELQFSTSEAGQLKQVKDFHRLLSTFKFN